MAQRFVCYPKESDQNIPSDSEVQSVNHGVQFFDMKKLLKLSPKKPKTFGLQDYGWMNITDGIPGRSHNVVANEELGYAVAVGTTPLDQPMPYLC